MVLEAGWGQLGRGLGDIARYKSMKLRKIHEIFSILEGFGRPLGVARGSKNLAFSCEGCSKSDFELDG